MLIDKSGDDLVKGADIAPAVLPKFSSNQIKCLHPIGTLIDHANVGIAGKF